MKRLCFSFFIISILGILCTSNKTFAQTSKEKEFKKALQGRLNEIFHQWDNDWSYDTYKDETAFVSTITESEYSNNSIIVTGTFEVIRKILFATQQVRVKFTAKIKITDSSLKITQVCYIDASAPNNQDCIEPSKWGVE